VVTIDLKDLIGRTFLKDAEEDGQRFRARVVRAIVDRETEQKKGHEYMKFICDVPDSMFDEIFTYNEILDHIERDNNDLENDTEQLYKSCHIAPPQGPLCPSDKDWKGSKYNVLVEWETGETIYEPLNAIAADDPQRKIIFSTQLVGNSFGALQRVRRDSSGLSIKPIGRVTDVILAGNLVS
jgi:hypothetical protein